MNNRKYQQHELCTQCSCWILLQGWRTSQQDLWNISHKNLYTVLLLDPSSRLKNKTARFLKLQQQILVHCALAGSFFKAEELVSKISEKSATRTCTLCSCWVLLKDWRTSLQDLWNISNNNLYTVLLLDPS